jgi:hypothetical protein
MNVSTRKSSLELLNKWAVQSAKLSSTLRCVGGSAYAGNLYVKDVSENRLRLCGADSKDTRFDVSLTKAMFSWHSIEGAGLTESSITGALVISWDEETELTLAESLGRSMAIM